MAPGGDVSVGRDEIRRLLRTQSKGAAALIIDTHARWTLNAFACGYARTVDKRGQISHDPTPGLYATLMAGLESFTALLQIGNLTDSRPNIRVTEGGQRYVSALPSRGLRHPAKDEWPFATDDAVYHSAAPRRSS